MLHINTETNPAVMAASGDPISIAAELCHAIGKLYIAFGRRDPHAAEVFRKAIYIGITEQGSQTWHLTQRPGETIVATVIEKGDN